MRTAGVPATLAQTVWARGKQEPDRPSRPSVGSIDWDERQVLDGGGFALVYQVAPGIVAKVGDVRPEEVNAQRHFAAKCKALPVLDYQEDIWLPDEVCEEVCPVHGLRSDIVADGLDCTCNEPRAVLLMPLAEPAWEDAKTPEGQAFMAEIAGECWEELGLLWDERPGNLAHYQGHLVALDFGEEEDA